MLVDPLEGIKEQVSQEDEVCSNGIIKYIEEKYYFRGPSSFLRKQEIYIINIYVLENVTKDAQLCKNQNLRIHRTIPSTKFYKS